MQIFTTKKDVDRLKAQIEIEPTGCWRWIGSKSKGGYGKFHLNGRRVPAHRASYCLYKGEIETGLLVLHSCDNPACVNPEHLRLGTHKENMDEIKSKGRGNKCGRKLTAEGVQQIRSMWESGKHTQKQLAAWFGIKDHCHLSDIVHRRVWQNC